MWRQAASATSVAGSGRSAGPDLAAPSISAGGPPRGSAPAFTIDRDKAVLRPRPHAADSIPIVVPLDSYCGVAVRMTAEAGGISVIVELRHSDPSLTLPLAVANDPEKAASEWEAWARALDLPLLIVEADGTVRAPLTLIGDLVAGPPRPRRRRSFLPDRRSRFLRRRRPGHTPGTERAAGREIIARH